MASIRNYELVSQATINRVSGHLSERFDSGKSESIETATKLLMNHFEIWEKEIKKLKNSDEVLPGNKHKLVHEGVHNRIEVIHSQEDDSVEVHVLGANQEDIRFLVNRKFISINHPTLNEPAGLQSLAKRGDFNQLGDIIRKRFEREKKYEKQVTRKYNPIALQLLKKLIVSSEEREELLPEALNGVEFDEKMDSIWETFGPLSVILSDYLLLTEEDINKAELREGNILVLPFSDNGHFLRIIVNYREERFSVYMRNFSGGPENSVKISYRRKGNSGSFALETKGFDKDFTKEGDGPQVYNHLAIASERIRERIGKTK